MVTKLNRRSLRAQQGEKNRKSQGVFSLLVTVQSRAGNTLISSSLTNTNSDIDTERE